jgi:lipid-binding SYLF domain-containing protein
MKRSIATAIVLVISMLTTSASVVADSKADIDKSVSHALKQFKALNPHLERLAKRAFGILVFPSVTLGGMAVAGDAYGEGVLQMNGKTIEYYSITSASIGVTAAGIERRSEIILFMTPEALEQLTSGDGWYIAASSTGGRVEREAGVSYHSETLQRLNILGFIFGSENLTADTSLKGSKITKIEK